MIPILMVNKYEYLARLAMTPMLMQHYEYLEGLGVLPILVQNK